MTNTDTTTIHPSSGTDTTGKWTCELRDGTRAICEIVGWTGCDNDDDALVDVRFIVPVEFPGLDQLVRFCTVEPHQLTRPTVMDLDDELQEAMIVCDRAAHDLDLANQAHRAAVATVQELNRMIDEAL